MEEDHRICWECSVEGGRQNCFEQDCFLTSDLLERFAVAAVVVAAVAVLAAAPVVGQFGVIYLQ